MSEEVRTAKIALGIIGNVDSGKSTLAGHLLHLTQHTTEHEQKKLDVLAETKKDKSFRYAFKLDTLEEERERGVTIKETLVEFHTPRHHFIISDLPGHASFSKNFLAGASQLDLCLLLIDVNDGIVDQTKEHLRIIISNGVKRIIAVINKMDTPTIDYSEAPFRKIETELTRITTPLKLDYLAVIPASAYLGENIVKRQKMDWYTGPTLLELLDTEPYPLLPYDKPLRFQINEIANKTGIGLVVQGKVSQGILRVNDTVMIKPSNKKGEVKSIEAFHRQIDSAGPNESIGVVLRGVTKIDVKKGYVVSHLTNTPKNAIELVIELAVVNATVRLKEASDLLMSHGTGITAVKIMQIRTIKDKTGTIIFDERSTESSKTQSIVRGQSAIVLVKPSKIIAIETAEENPRLGRCTLSNEKGLIAICTVLNVIVHSAEL